MDVANDSAKIPTAKRIEMWPLDRLQPYERNARTHSDDQVGKIAASIREFGFTNPILVDGEAGIIAGHGRLAAARSLGMDTVPVIELTHLSDSQKRAYILADNKLAELAGWDEAMLAEELLRLNDDGFGLGVIGFSDDELAELLPDVRPSSGMPELPNGDKSEFEQITFTLHRDQAEQVRAAMDAAKDMGPFIDSPNENSNGNAIARICETFLTDHGNG